MHDDAVYFGRRASEERIAAASARHPGAREAHLQMAQRYDDLASELAVSWLWTVRSEC